MLQTLFSMIGDWRARKRQSPGKINCFHCGDSVKATRAVFVEFDGASHAVCCHGCAAVLKTVQQMGMLQQYRAQKEQAAKENDA